MKVQIGAIPYQVCFERLEEKDISEIDLSANKITVEPGLPQNQQTAAILHESIHAINWKLSENEVEYLAQAIYAFLMNNREFIHDILEEKDHERRYEGR